MIHKHAAAAVFLMLLTLVSCLSAHAVTFPPRPGEREFIYDEAGLISVKDAEEIRKHCDGLLTDRAIPIVVVTIKSLSKYGAGGWPIDRYANELFDEWGVGHDKLYGQRSKKKYSWNYGILLIVSKGDRKTRIELGADWGSEKDSKCEQIMNDLIISRFKAGDFSGGILLGTQALANMARGKQLPTVPRPWWHYLAIAGFIGLMIFTFVSLYQRGSSGWAWIFWGGVFAFLGWLLIAMLTRRSRFGGGSFGGGFSGGGGATGSW